MLSLTYLSSAAHLLSSTELAELLVLWRPRNHERHITGLLLYSGGNIIQTLEGPDDEVTSTFADIARDPRHTGVIEVLRDPIEERAFPDWSMGFNDVSDVDTTDIEGFNDYLLLSNGQAGPGRQQVQTMFEIFKRYNP
ncbi:MULTISPECIES: BLUF domain-containing protein [unclassified Nocardioides]|uniref:BLUF domain-containing protein n=1 Tax=unclassified Nocardioides TaxID=2615069 RepID=UPI003014390C